MSGWALALFLVAVLLPSFLISLVAVGVVRRAAEKLGLLDKPGERKVHTTPIPLGGGIGIWAGVMGTLLLGTIAVLVVASNASLAAWFPDAISSNFPGLLDKVQEIWVIAACGTVLMFLGLMDDRKGIPWWLRLGVEFAVASFCVYWQGLQLTAYIDLPWLTSALSVIWIVALINSFNMLDNMDGLSGGVAAISTGMLAVMLLMNNLVGSAQPQLFVAAMLLVLVGA
ncbi:MAG: MraY family glycosyltransferase, partial [Planctomycetota bacterium]